MTILITGIHGFVGSNLVEALKSNHAIYGLDIKSTWKDGVERTYKWDEINKIPPVDVIIHLAGKAHETKNESIAQEYFEVNTGLTQKIFDYFLDSDAKTFVFFSTVKAAADIVESGILTEEVDPNPVGPYAKSKRKAEEYILSKLFDAEQKGKKVYILRPCMIHGPGNKGNLNLLYQVVSRGVPWPLGAYDNKRSFCSIDNIAYVIEQLFQRENIAAGIYQVGDDEPISTNELIQLISASVGKKAVIWNLPKRFINILACVLGFLSLPLNKERLRKLTENYVVSNQKIKNALGIDRMPVTTVEGMKKTLESFKLK